MSLLARARGLDAQKNEYAEHDELKPVTLVATVVARKKAFHPLDGASASACPG
jgi:hypothetical protein